MRWRANTLKSPQVRRLVVALSITGAGAAVAATVVWAELAQSDRLESASVSSAGRVSVTPARRHVQIALPEQVGARSSVRGDASLPDAKEALQGVGSEPVEPAPTF